MLVVDCEGTVYDINPAASRLFPGLRDQGRGLKLHFLLGDEAARKVLRSAEEGSTSNVDMALATTSGNQMDLRILGMPFSDPEGQPFVQVILQDITGERRRQRSLQTFAAHMLQAQEEERRRIARELHDESIQSLVLLCRELDVLSAKWSEDRYALKEGIRQVRHLAEQVVEELREFTRRLRPPILEELGLAACLRRMALELGERTGISVGVSLQGCRARLPLNTELALFRIAQEALHNVERHSMATRCSIELHCTSDVVRLVVADDGQGFVFDPARIATDPDRHLGLIGMHERAQAIGGKLRVRSLPGKGTTIEVTLPVGSATKPGQSSR